MPYYGLFSCDLHTLVGFTLCALFVVEITSVCTFLWQLPLCALLLCSITYYGITRVIMLLGTSIVTSYHSITMHNEVAMNLFIMCYYALL